MKFAYLLQMIRYFEEFYSQMSEGFWVQAGKKFDMLCIYYPHCNDAQLDENQQKISL